VLHQLSAISPGFVFRAAAVAAVLATGCSRPWADNPEMRNDLGSMERTTVRIGDHTFEVWLALDDGQRQRGLMNVTEDQLAPIAGPQGDSSPKVQRGMLFAFPFEQPLSFWMLNTIIPLDIAYIAPDGRIMKTYTMAPLETRTYPSIEPAQFALELRAGLLAELGITSGQYVQIPDSVLKDVR